MRSRCLQRGDLSSAPLTTALTHASRSIFFGLLYGIRGSSEASLWQIAMAAVLKTLMIFRQAWRSTGWSHIDEADRSCDDSNVRFKGLPRTDRRLVAVGSRLANRCQWGRLIRLREEMKAYSRNSILELNRGGLQGPQECP